MAISNIKQFIYTNEDIFTSLELNKNDTSAGNVIIGSNNLTEIQRSVLSQFYSNPCLSLEKSLILSNENNTDKNYYMKVHIKRTSKIQKFFIYALNKKQIDTNDVQYIKTIQIAPFSSEKDKWETVEFILKPMINNIDCIVFTLEKKQDFFTDPVNPIIVYEEISEVKSLLTDKNITQIGIQGKVGTLLSINGEEIHIPENGIYEIRNSLITINSFGCAYSDAVIEFDSTEEDKKTMKEFLEGNEITKSTSYVHLNRTYNKENIKPLIVDYIYK